MTRNFLLATALSLAIALGSLMMLGGSNAQASSYDGVTFNAAPVTDADACSTTGYTYNASYYPFTSDPNLAAVQTTYPAGYIDPATGLPYAGFPYYGYLYGGFPYYGIPIMGGVPNVLYVNPVAVAPPNPWPGQPYTSPTQVNYACNAFSNCDPVANAGAVVCPGNPAGITLNSSLTSATCGSATNIDAKVVGPSGMIVADGTPVLFSTTLGMVPGDTSTDAGIASVSLVFPPKTSGVATLTVTSGTAKAEAKITVTC